MMLADLLQWPPHADLRSLHQTCDQCDHNLRGRQIRSNGHPTPICLTVYLSIYLSVYLSIYFYEKNLSIYVLIIIYLFYLFNETITIDAFCIYLSIYLSVCLSIYLSIYLSMFYAYVNYTVI
jgi:hypothetical protein